MDTFRRVVVGVDGTEWGFEALRQALALCPATGSVGHVVTVLDSGPAARLGFDSCYWTAMLEEEAAETKEQAAAMLGGRPGWDARIVAGPPLTVLREARDNADATLVAVGARHSSRFLGVLLGDTTTELVHDGVSSMLLARPPEKTNWESRRLIVGVDGSAPSLAALETADDLVKRLGSTLEVVSATHGQSAPGGEWTKRVDTWETAHPVQALVERSAHADLVIVGSRGLHGVRALGSVSERLAHHAHCSVLIVQQ